MKPITHGTDYGYQMHRARGEQACRDCLDAHAEAGRRRRQADPAHQRTGRTRHARAVTLATFKDLAPDLYVAIYREAAAQWDRDHQETQP